MTQRDSLVTMISFFREQPEGIAAVMNDKAIAKALKVMEKRANRLREKQENRFAVVEIDATAALVLGRGQIVADFQSGFCRVDNRRKAPHSAVCESCYYRLPASLRKALGLSFGAGFEQAYEQALTKLGVAVPELAAKLRGEVACLVAAYQGRAVR